MAILIIYGSLKLNLRNKNMLAVPAIHDNRNMFLFAFLAYQIYSKKYHGFRGPVTLRSWPDAILLSCTSKIKPSSTLEDDKAFLYNTLIQHFSTRHFSISFCAALLPILYKSYSTLLKHPNTSLQQFLPTRLYNTFSNTSLSPTLLYNNRLAPSLLQHSPPTLCYNTSSTLLQQFSTTLFSNTSLQHSSPTLLQNTPLTNHRGHMNPNVNAQISFQQSSMGLL